MANIAVPKKLSQTALTTTLTTLLYTTPADSAVVKEILLCNTGSSSADVTIFAGTGTAIVDTILDAFTVNAHETVFFTLSTVLDVTEIISGGASVDAVVSCIISGVEVS